MLKNSKKELSLTPVPFNKTNNFLQLRLTAAGYRKYSKPAGRTVSTAINSLLQTNTKSPSAPEKSENKGFRTPQMYAKPFFQIFLYAMFTSVMPGLTFHFTQNAVSMHPDNPGIYFLTDRQETGSSPSFY